MNDNLYTNVKIAETVKNLAKKIHAEKGMVKVLFLGQIFAFAGLFITGKTLAHDLMYSRYQPDYALYAVKLIAGLSMMITFQFIKSKIRRNKHSYKTIHVDPVQDNIAYISGNFLVLERDTDKGKKQMVFELDRIRRVKSGGGVTSFMYNDPAQGFIEFSTEVSYEPGIAALLRARGIGID